MALSSRSADPDPVDSRDDPARARLGRVAAYFYLHPPKSGAPPDGLPVPQVGPLAATTLLQERMLLPCGPLSVKRPPTQA